jgi:hypothetical protein
MRLPFARRLRRKRELLGEIAESGFLQGLKCVRENAVVVVRESRKEPFFDKTAS